MKLSYIHIAFIFCLVLLSGCEKEFNDGYELFVIKKGKHYATMKFATLQSDHLMFQAKFDETAIYESELPENQWDINKLYGFSEGNSHHHDNSARFGWRWLNDQIEIFAYVYVDGERISEQMGSTWTNESELYEIILLPDSYRFRFKDKTFDIERKSAQEKPVLHYLLFPYFGGDETAPHDIYIHIKTLY